MESTAVVHKGDPEQGTLDLLDMSEVIPGVLYLVLLYRALQLLTSPQGSRRAAHSYNALQARKVSDIISVLIEDQR